jgi:hypothetical protein
MLDLALQNSMEVKVINHIFGGLALVESSETFSNNGSGDIFGLSH